MKECHLQVQLPGTFFCRNQRWWWRVRLPGEDRVKSRSLRPDGAQWGTKRRKEAETVAFDLWQQALIAETEARVRLDTRYQSQEKAKAYANLVSRLSTRAQRLVAQQTNRSKRRQASVRRASPSKSTSAKTSPSGPKRKEQAQVTKALSNAVLDFSGIDHATSIVITAQCDCCATPFIPEVELSQIESGQNLCSKCMYYLRDAECRQKRPQPENNPV